MTTITGTGQLEGWSKDIRLTFTNSRSIGPAIAVEGNYVHVVYADNESGGKYDLFLWYTRSNDSGKSWVSPICITNTTPKKVSSPKIAVYKSNIHVIWLDWNDNRLYYINSLDNGNSWNTVRVLTPTIYPYMENWDIEIHENFIHVIYINSGNIITYIYSNNNGINWSNPKLPAPSITKVIDSVLAVQGNDIHIALRVNRKITSDILYIRSTDNGANWDTYVDVSSVSGIDTLCSFPDITVTNNDIFIVYRDEDFGGTRQIFYSYSNDNGFTWSKRIRLSNSTSIIASVVDPHITAENDNICVVWVDPRNAIDGGTELYCKISSNKGNTWSADTRLTNASKASDLPDILIYRNITHVVWTDGRDENLEIYYKQMILPSSLISAVVDIKPDTLNLKSKGKWITAYIELPHGHNVNDIEISSVLLENTIPAENHPTEVGDYDSDGIPDLMIKFDRSDLEDYINRPRGSITLTISGNKITNETFGGSDIIRVIHPP